MGILSVSYYVCAQLTTSLSISSNDDDNQQNIQANAAHNGRNTADHRQSLTLLGSLEVASLAG